MKKRDQVRLYIFAIYILLIAVSVFLELRPGREIGENFLSFAVEMCKVLPGAFILIGLFEVWVKKQTVEKHLGKGSNALAYLWAIVLASTTVGGLYVAFPVASSLYKKGAKLSIIFTYLGAAAICRVPMTLFEASFMGLKFSIIRLLVSLPLVIATSIALGRFLERRNYKISVNH